MHPSVVGLHGSKFQVDGMWHGCFFLYWYGVAQVLVTVLSNMWVFGNSVAGIMSSNPTKVMEVRLMYLLCVIAIVAYAVG